MSRLVLGGALLGKFPQSDVDQLLHAAHECGIDKIETASGYIDSEKRIGKFLKGQSIFSINSKVGWPDLSMFTPSGIRVSVENSLRDLGIEQIGTLFIHSLDKMYLTDENVSALVRLKAEGKIAQIGYSGDGDNLSAAVKRNSFDDFMMTFNIINQANSDILAVLPNHYGIYFKVPLARAIWAQRLTFYRRVANFTPIRKVFNKPPFTDTDRNRFFKLKRQMANKDYATEFLKFALFSGNANQYVVLGASSSLHIRHAVGVESQKPDLIQISSYSSLWNEIK
jgi:aryl-alcohol dehydrogenase-like predicted oxidoreductase